MKSTLNINDKVKLISKKYGCKLSNPVWGIWDTNTAGTIVNINYDSYKLPIKVEWDNGEYNLYSQLDLEKITGYYFGSFLNSN